MPNPGDPKQTWLIEQFLRGNLPPTVHNQVEERMAADADFEHRVMAQWLVLNYLDEQRQVTDLYQKINPIIVASGTKKATYGSYKDVRFLVQLVGIAAFLLLCLGVSFLAYRYNQPLTKQVSTIPITIDDPEEYGFSMGDDSVEVIQYDRVPNFWSFGKKYTWEAGTLAVYGLPAEESVTKNWQIKPTARRNTYLLNTGRQTYELLKGQTNLTSLIPNENP